MRAVPVTIVIPTLDGGGRFRDQLEALARLAPAPERVLVIDSGSRDGSDALAERAGHEVVRIARAEFDHGATRQRGAELARTELVAFLSQDAVPEPDYLGHLAAAFADPLVAGATARILPYADSTPLARRTALASPLAAAAPRVAAIDPAAFAALPPHERRRLCLFDDVASMVRRGCLLSAPFPRTMMGEDQAFAEAALERGWRLAFVPAAVVHHAHEYGPVSAFLRYRDDARFVRAKFGERVRRGPLDLLKGVAFEVREDLRALRQESGARRCAEALRSAPLRCGQVLGQWWGSTFGIQP